MLTHKISCYRKYEVQWGSEQSSTGTQASHEAPRYQKFHNLFNDAPAERCSAAGSHGLLAGWKTVMG
jgi:hypothetical protein